MPYCCFRISSGKSIICMSSTSLSASAPGMIFRTSSLFCFFPNPNQPPPSVALPFAFFASSSGGKSSKVGSVGLMDFCFFADGFMATNLVYSSSSLVPRLFVSSISASACPLPGVPPALIGPRPWKALIGVSSGPSSSDSSSNWKTFSGASRDTGWRANEGYFGSLAKEGCFGASAKDSPFCESDWSNCLLPLSSPSLSSLISPEGI